MRWIVAICLWVALATGAVAQDSEEEDKGRITRYLEETLSGLGREVRIDGFRGALSSRVSMDRMTIADDEGVWLTLTDAVLDWNRAAILRGRINIDQITAASIDVARLPVAEEEEGSPEAASGFSLPELPVSIDIKSIGAEEVNLGESILGEAVTLSLAGAVTLEGGQGQADLSIERLDGKRGLFNLVGSYANTTRQLALDLTLDEAQDGITARLLNLPGRPALELTVTGDAPIDEFVAEIALKSDGVERLAGQVSTQIESAASGPAAEDVQDPPRLIWVDIAGDLAPLFAPQYQPFFGDDVALQSLLRLFPDGRVTLQQLKLQAAAMLLEGEAEIAAGGVPERFRLNGVLEDPDQGTVVLPLSGAETEVRRAVIFAAFDASEGDTWTLNADLDGFERPDLSLREVELSASGAIRTAEAVEVTAALEAAVRGIDLDDPALARAVGDALRLTGDLRWSEGQPLVLNDMLLTGEGMRLAGSGRLEGMETLATFDGAFQALIEDLSRFSDLAGRPLTGRADAELTGQAALLTGAFDLDLTAIGTDLGVGIAQVDGALAGESRLSVSGKRDETGLTLRAAKVETVAGTASANGFINSGQTNFEFQAALDDLSRFVSGIVGPVTLSGEATEHDTGWLVDLEGTGPYQSEAKGRLAVPDDGGPSVKLTGAIGNVGAILPDLPGSASFEATARQEGEAWAINTTGTGPGGSTFAVAGNVRADASAATLDIDGTLPLALANRRISPNAAQGMAQVDLRLDGPLQVSSVSGRVTTSGARLSLPALQNALTGLDADITLSGGTAAITTSTTLATGGRIVANGQVGTQAPFATRLGVQILNAVIRDPKLYETVVQGNLNITGTAPGALTASGALNLDRTEIRVPSTGLGRGAIPDIDHVNEPAAVRQTRSRAGLLQDEAGPAGQSGGGFAMGLDIGIAADNQVFIRGRGLDAELGGRFRLTGTTAEIIPIGAFNLIRGRLDILGKRLSLDEGTARLLGDFVPGLRLVASTVSDDDTLVQIIIEGRANDPEVSFVSDPALPEDEVLARLLFGREISSLSAFQALQLASAVATLAGRGGTSLTEQIRENTGLDDFSVSSDSEGNATLGVGKYISDNIYTDVQVGDESNTEINLNIDLSRRTKLRGSLGADGGTGLGVFFEKDY